MHRKTLLTAGLIALLSRAQPEAERIVPKMPKRMKTGETPNQILAAYDVFVDGVKQLGTCIEAEQGEPGYVVRYVVGKGGGRIEKQGEYLTERVEGVKVEFRLKTF